MVTLNDVIHLPLSKAEIIATIIKAQQNFSIAQCDNLRNRHPNIQFDCILRGYVGEYAVTKWFAQNEITLTANNTFIADEQMDIDFIYKGKNIELKTSLLPDIDGNLPTTIAKRDIKLIKRGNDTIEQLKGDIHIQIFYTHKRKAKDTWLAKQNIDLQSTNFEYLYDALTARGYVNATQLTAWIDKPSLVQKINNLPENDRYWSFIQAQRKFWNCKIKEAHPPIDLISYLKNIAE
jgi:hypothetical protein